jgi:predicted small secreted protein
MRTSISILALIVASTSVAACAGGPGEDVASGEAPLPIATFIPPPPPAPLPAYSFISGYAGMPGEAGHDDGSVATRFVQPTLITANSTGVTWVLDQDPPNASQARLRIIFDTRGTANPHVQTIFGPSAPAYSTYFDLNMIRGMTMDPASLDLYVTGFINRVFKLTLRGDVVPVTSTAGFNNPVGIVRDPQGKLYVANSGTGGTGGGIAVVVGGVVTPLPLTGAPAGFSPTTLARDDRNGTLYTISQNALFAISATGQVRLFAGIPNYVIQKGVRFNNPQGLAVDRSGNVYVADTGAHVIRKARVDWGTTLLALETVSNLQTGTDLFGNQGYGPSDAVIQAPTGLAMWGDSLLFTDADRRTVRRVD